MTDKEKIKEEIERRFNDNMKASEQYTENSKSRALFTSAAKEDYDLLAFIDSLPEEHNEDLEEYYTKEFLPKEWFAKPGQITISQFNFFTARHFAEWQKQQMMKEAINGIMDCDDDNEWIEITDKLIVTPSKAGKKIKFIVVKED